MSKTTTTTDATPAATGDTVVAPAQQANTSETVAPAVTSEPVVTQIAPAATKPTPVTPVPETFTQADIDRIVKERVARERAKFADYDDLKAKAAKLEEIEPEYQKTKTTVATVQGEAEQAKLQAAIVAAAARLGFADPNDALALVKVGKLDEAEGALKALLEAKPYLARKNAPALTAANPSRDEAQPAGRTDADRRREYFGGGAGNFWQGRGSTVSTRGQESAG